MSTDQISATEPAFAELASLRERYGPLMLFQSGGCCDGSSPLCLHEGELLVGPNDLLLGEIGGTPFYIDLANTNAGTGPPSRSIYCPGRPTRSRSKDLTASTSSAAPLPARHADVMMPLPLAHCRVSGLPPPTRLLHMPLALISHRRGLSTADVLAALYPLLRRPILAWGATASEAASRLPGDELLEDADGVSTRAITIAAPADAVWPWLAQMGPSPRGGAYTYDWIENLLRLNMHSVDRVLPEFQNPHAGDTLDYGRNRMRLERVEPQRVLSWRSENGNWVWTFVLDEDHGQTRLISRNRFRLPTLVSRIGMLPMEPGSLVMERKMLRGIKERAERLASTTRVTRWSRVRSMVTP
jgi:hypothetical protein